MVKKKKKSIHHHKFLRLFVYGYSLMTPKNRFPCSKKYGIQSAGRRPVILVFCKFEIVIFKIVQVMTENIPFAFLYVLSI